MGDAIDNEYFYRSDTTLIGIILLLLLALRLFKTDSKKVKYLTPFCMMLITLFFTSFLPIHVTTASRLVIRTGSYVIILGSTVLFLSNFSDTIYASVTLMINKFLNTSLIVKIYVFSNIAYLIIKYVIY